MVAIDILITEERLREILEMKDGEIVDYPVDSLEVKCFDDGESRFFRFRIK